MAALVISTAQIPRCPVCKDEVDLTSSMAALSCGHAFCFDCIGGFIDAKQPCPFRCKDGLLVVEEDIRPIQLALIQPSAVRYNDKCIYHKRDPERACVLVYSSLVETMTEDVKRNAASIRARQQSLQQEMQKADHLYKEVVGMQHTLYKALDDVTSLEDLFTKLRAKVVRIGKRSGKLPPKHYKEEDVGSLHSNRAV